MASPVPKHLFEDFNSIRPDLIDHINDIHVDPRDGVKVEGAGVHRAKFAAGLATVLAKLAGTDDIGDPFAGTGTLAHETGLPCKLNDLDKNMGKFLNPLVDQGCEISYVSACELPWKCNTLIFSPPYYPRTDRRRPCAHDDSKRGAVVGFRDSYECNAPKFVGQPGGVNAIATYRHQMTDVYSHFTSCADRMIIVTKNWMRLGVELRLDLDTISMAETVGWSCVERHGFQPKPSLWSRYNAERGKRQGRLGMIQIEDILVFERV